MSEAVTPQTPFATTHEVRIAIQQLVFTRQGDKKRGPLLSRLACSGEQSVSVFPKILEGLHKYDDDLKMAVFKLLDGYRADGLDISECAAGLATFLGGGNADVRNGALKVLAALGPRAKGAEAYAIGCLRSSDRAVKQAGALVLRAIGPACSRGALPKIKEALGRGQNSDSTVMLLTGAAKQILAARARR
jgi:hypothetical protein